MIPGVSGGLAAVVGMIAAFVYRSDLTEMVGVSPDSWYYGILGLVVFLFGLLLSALLGFATASIAGGYFIELLVEKLLTRSGIKKTEINSSIGQMAMSILRALGNEAILVFGILFCTVLAFGLSFLPFLSLLPLFMGVLIAGFTLFNLPLALLELPLKRRLAVVKQQLLPCATLGACFSAILLIPFASVALLPAFYGASCELLAQNPTLKEDLKIGLTEEKS
jgi:uncharacterized protein involved in cysteine biosynthesis